MAVSPVEHANAIYTSAHDTCMLQVWFSKPEVGDFVIILFTRRRDPLRQVGKLIKQGRERIPEWGHPSTWDKRDLAEYLAGGLVGTQEVWEIECLDGERKRWTNVSVVRVPDEFI